MSVFGVDRMVPSSGSAFLFGTFLEKSYCHGFSSVFFIIFLSIHLKRPKQFYKFFKIQWCQTEPVGLANRIKNVFPLFPGNIQYRARLKGPTFEFFGIVGHWHFFPTKIFPKGSPSIFVEFCDRMDVEKSQRFPPFSFFGIVRLFFHFFNTRVPHLTILWHFEALFLILSLWYGADLGRSRLVVGCSSQAERF